MRRFYFFLLTILYCVPITLSAQSIHFALAEKETFQITGDSNVRAWQAEITEAEGLLILNGSASEALHDIQSLSLSIHTESILSDSNVLNGTMHNSLRSEEYPRILFSLTEVLSAEPDGDAFLIGAGRIPGYHECKSLF